MTVRKMNATFLERSIFIGAYLRKTASSAS